MLAPSSILRFANTNVLRSTSSAASKNLQYQTLKAFSSSAFRMTLISDALKDDHSKIKEYHQNILKAQTDDEKTRWQNQFVWELARHSVAEELIVYPAFEAHLGQEGIGMAEKDREEHHRVKEQLVKFQSMKPSAPEFETTLQKLMGDLLEHIKEEENDDLPKLESALDNATSEKLTTTFGRTKAFVPSRAHTVSGSGHEGPPGHMPPFETAVGLMTAPIDHVRDLFAKFPNTKMPNPSTQ